MEVDPADLADTRCDQQVRRIARKARTSDAVLHDIEGIDHDAGDTWPSPGAEELSLHRALSRKQLAESPLRRSRLDQYRRGLRCRAMRKDGGAVGEHVARKVGGDDDLGSKRTRRGHRHRVYQSTIHEPAVADQHR